jgi:ribulose-5-phosphate 4-epimerase/fuculose-1-phosphate aldolase
MKTLMQTKQEIFLQVQGDVVRFPEQPTFADKQAERLHVKQRLAASYRIFSLYGFDSGIAGHISARDPILSDHFWVNPLAVHFSQIRVSDLVLVDHAGQIVEGRHSVNAAAFAIHSRIHKERPDVSAAAHSHSRFGTTFASLGKQIPPITQDACAFYKDHVVMQAYGGVAAEISEGQMIADALGPHKAIICRNHGHFTVGQTVDEAVFWFLRMERAFEQTLLAWSAGTPVEIDDATATMAAKQVGSAKAGWFGMQPLMNKIITEQPDILE